MPGRGRKRPHRQQDGEQGRDAKRARRDSSPSGRRNSVRSPRRASAASVPANGSASGEVPTPSRNHRLPRRGRGGFGLFSLQHGRHHTQPDVVRSAAAERYRSVLSQISIPHHVMQALAQHMPPTAPPGGGHASSCNAKYGGLCHNHIARLPVTEWSTKKPAPKEPVFWREDADGAIVLDDVDGDLNSIGATTNRGSSMANGTASAAGKPVDDSLDSEVEFVGELTPSSTTTVPSASPAALPPATGTTGSSSSSSASTSAAADHSCRVCLESFAEGDVVLTLPCFHRFHKECILPWFREHVTCPMCKDDVRARARETDRQAAAAGGGEPEEGGVGEGEGGDEEDEEEDDAGAGGGGTRESFLHPVWDSRVGERMGPA